MTSSNNAELVGRYLEEARKSSLPLDVREAAKSCLLDWFGVTVAGSAEPVTKAVLAASRLEKVSLPILGSEDPETAARTNGVAAHALDFDDTHIPTDSHISAVTWSTLFALADPLRHNGLDLLRAFIAGYEVAAKLSGRRLGFSLQFRWFHPTAVIGRLSAAAAASVLTGLGWREAAQAVALSTTMASGLRGTLGSMGKAMQVGAAASDGIACARLAAAGIEVDTDVLSPGGGFVRAFVQDESACLADLSQVKLGEDWAVLRTSFKPYACLHGIHPSIDAAIELTSKFDPAVAAAVKVYVAPGVKKVAHFEKPQTPLEAKFSVHFCVAAALTGQTMAAESFTQNVLNDPDVQRLMNLIEVIPAEGRKMLDSAVQVEQLHGPEISAEISLSRGHPGNPLSWEELEQKFCNLVRPIYGDRASTVVSTLKKFEETGSVAELHRLCR